jgi:signal transduction histidine kinase
MAGGHAPRVRVHGPLLEARRLCARLSRGGIPAALDDGSSRAEVLVVMGEKDVAPFRQRAGHLVAVGKPGASLYASGADEVVMPDEPETLFRRLRGVVERIDLLARVERLGERIAALESGLADAAHDVRSPLQAVIGNAELLARDSSLTPRQRECAAAAARQALRAMQLAERILDSAKRRDRTAVESRPLDLGKLLETAAEHGQSQARQRGVTLVANPPVRPVELRGDQELLARLLENLVANAVRVTPRGGQVEVSGWRVSPKGVRLAVKDSGGGISSAELPKLLAGLGPGRGLRIARDIAERHGGELWAESGMGNGSRFYVELPLAPPSSRPRVLIVSDDARWLREVSRSLRTACDVRAVSPSAAKLGNKPTDLVLVEARLARGKKLEALRLEASGAQVPLVEMPTEMAAARLARTLAHLA